MTTRREAAITPVLTVFCRRVDELSIGTLFYQPSDYRHDPIFAAGKRLKPQPKG